MRLLNNKILTEEQESLVASLYIDGKNTTEIATEFNMWPNSIRNILIKKGIKRRDASFCQKRNSVNQNVFETIDTKEKAYWLGFLYADGYNNEEKAHISIGLSIKDKEHLQKLKDFFETNCKLGIYVNGTVCSISINNKKLSSDLAKKGCFQRKSLTLKFPTEEQVSNSLIWHFLRGVFDGDGSISLDDFSLSIATSKFFAEGLMSFCQKNNIISYIYKNKKQNCFYFKIGKRIEFAKFFEKLYKDSINLRLDRKYQRYEKTIKKLDNYVETLYNYLQLRKIIN